LPRMARASEDIPTGAQLARAEKRGEGLEFVKKKKSPPILEQKRSLGRGRSGLPARGGRSRRRRGRAPSKERGRREKSLIPRRHGRRLKKKGVGGSPLTRERENEVENRRYYIRGQRPLFHCEEPDHIEGAKTLLPTLLESSRGGTQLFKGNYGRQERTGLSPLDIPGGHNHRLLNPSGRGRRKEARTLQKKRIGAGEIAYRDFGSVRQSRRGRGGGENFLKKESGEQRQSDLFEGRKCSKLIEKNGFRNWGRSNRRKYLGRKMVGRRMRRSVDRTRLAAAERGYEFSRVGQKGTPGHLRGHKKKERGTDHRQGEYGKFEDFDKASV